MPSNFGLIGLLRIDTYSYLISITQRQQVAQIFGKPVFVITDVAFTPLASQAEATKAIAEAIAAQKKGDQIEHDTDSSGESDVEPAQEPQTPGDPVDSTPTHNDGDERPLQQRTSSGTSIVQDVIINRAQYGKVASQWFSRKAWAQGRLAPTTTPTSGQQKPLSDATSSTGQDLPVEKVTTAEAGNVPGKSTQDAAVALIPKILRGTRLILTSRSFFFSYDIDITRRMGKRTLEELNYNTDARTAPDQMYFWNKNLAVEFTSSPKDSFLMPIMQGFVGQRSFVVKREHEHTRAVEQLEAIEATKPESSETDPNTPGNCSRTFLLTLISRRSTKRSGLRYLRRGIDDLGDCANAVETEQILCSPTWQGDKIRSFSQYRGSIPLYFSQTPYAFKPVPILQQSSSKNQAAMRRHFEALEKEYGGVQAALLVDKSGSPEFKIGEAYVEGVKELNQSLKPPIDIYWFDFHAECRGMKFENVDRLVKIVQDKIDAFGETVLEKGVVTQTQKGIIRTNCMDCLDRTNVSQSAIGQYVLQKDLQTEGYHIDLLHDEATQWFNSLWADNGDAISRQYAGTAALKGDFTRTRKRNYRGALNDLGLTLNRYYNNMVNDFFSQAVIDLLVGNVTSKVFEDFESDMMSADPGVSLSGVRDAAIETCTKIVMQEDEDLIHGYTLMCPAQPNTLRTLPFEEAVVLLTDFNIYCCKFDWNTTQKVSSFEKIDLRSITKIQYGTYITSTLSERQMVEALNVGLVIQYNPDKNSVMRVNTRSLQNVVSNEQVPQGVDGGTGLMSWVASRTSGHVDNGSRTLALKVIPAETGLSKSTDTPMAIAERICDDIRRATTGSTDNGEQMGQDLVKKGDIISLVEAKKRTGYLEQLGHSIKKLVWT